MSYRAGFIGLIGQPNAGKSTLMNYLIKEKVSIVTSKPQTTRRRILGILNEKNAQIILIDAPGLVKADSGLNSFLEKEATEVIKESDALLAVLSIDEKSADDIEKVIGLVKLSKKPWAAVVTKADIAEKEHRILITKAMIEEAGGKCVVISCLKEDKSTRIELVDMLVNLLPEASAPLYDRDLYTTENVRELAAEIIREKCFENLTHELPYQLAIQIRKFDENAKPCPHIYADLIVGKETHKPIVVGKSANVIKKISKESREEIQKLMGEKIFLEVNVVVRENWFNKKQLMKELGYQINET